MGKVAKHDGQLPMFEGLPSHTGDVKTLRLVKDLERTTIVPRRFTYVQDDDQLEECVALCRETGIMAIDCETTGLLWKDRSVAISITSGKQPNLKSWMIPTDMVYAKRNFLPHEVRAALDPVLSDPAIKKINHNIKFDMHKIRRTYGLDAWANVYHDTMIAQWVLNENEPHGLETICETWLNAPAWKIKNDGKFGLWPINVATNYACGDTEQTMLLYEFQCEHLELLPELRTLFYDVEMPHMLELYDAEKVGIAWDDDYAKNIMEPEIDAALAQAEIDCRKHLGNINLGSSQQLAAVIFDGLGLPESVKTIVVNGDKVQVPDRSLDKRHLANLRGLHPVVEALERWKKFNKAKDGFVTSLQTHVEDGRVHPTFAPIGTVTGRLSCKEPNLQNLPKQSLGPVIRRAFVPSPGHVLVTMDYSQIELRLLAHFSQDPTLLDIFRSGRDIHAETMHRMFGSLIPGADDATLAALRVRSKTVSFGVLYGMGPNKLRDTVNFVAKRDEDKISFTTAEDIQLGYFETYPGVDRYIEKQKRLAKRKGYVTTILGRKRRLPNANSPDRKKASAAGRQAVNAPIQGSAADMIKLATIKVANAFRSNRWPYRLLLQVHDELIMEVPKEWLQHNRGTLDILAKIYANAIPLSVPVVVEPEILSRWGDKLVEDEFELDIDDLEEDIA